MTSNQAGADTELTVIGRGTTIRGEVEFENGARILGVFEGKIRARGEVQIGETAECKAEVDAEQVVIEGTMYGDITAHERLHLSGTARLTGDICATKLLVDEGASFVGHCRVGQAATEAAASKASGQQVCAPVSEPPGVATITTRVDADKVDFKPPWREQSEPLQSTEAGTEAGAA